MSRVTRAAAMVLVLTVVALIPKPAHADEIRDSQWHLQFLDVGAAHRVARGQGVVVAVVDTGVDPHPDLRKNLLPGAVIDPSGTGDGRRDQDGHGTGMAGLIAAHGAGPSTGALGIAPEAKILPITANVGDGQGNNDFVAAGIEWATAHGADVINISSHGGPSSRLREAVEAAQRANVVVVAAAGNKPDLGVGFPAFYPGVIAVGASDRSGNVAEISVTGKGLVLLAPGVDINATYPGNRYQRAPGTSNSAAIVSGAAALVRSRFPDLPAAEVMHRLTATATDKGAPGWDEQYGYGVLNLVAALTADVPPSSAQAVTAPTAAPPERDGDGDGRVLPIALAVLVGIGAGVAAVVWRGRARRRKGEPVA